MATSRLAILHILFNIKNNPSKVGTLIISLFGLWNKSLEWQGQVYLHSMKSRVLIHTSLSVIHMLLTPKLMLPPAANQQWKKVKIRNINWIHGGEVTQVRSCELSPSWLWPRPGKTEMHSWKINLLPLGKCCIVFSKGNNLFFLFFFFSFFLFFFPFLI